MPTLFRVSLVVTTILCGGVEVLLLELVRTPYRPPDDMLTLMGQEKYGVFLVMGLLFASWAGFVVYCGLRFRSTRRDWIAFAAVAGLSVAVAALVVTYPQRPVTPLHLICK